MRLRMATNLPRLSSVLSRCSLCVQDLAMLSQVGKFWEA